MTNAKKINSYFWIALTFTIVFIILLSLPFTAKAADLGSETPEIYFEYYDENNAKVDGNTLSAGTYNVNIMLSGVENISTVEVTATYDSSVVLEQPTPNQLLSDTVTNMKSMGYLLDDGNMVFGFVSTEDASTSLGGDVLLASFAATFTTQCDAADVISVLNNPNYTFVQADYNDGYENEYAIDTQYANYVGKLYPMNADVSPELKTAHSVTGELVIAINSKGETNGKKLNSESKIEVFSTPDRSDTPRVFTSVLNENSNSFVIDSLADGTYYATISAPYAIPRNVTIVVNGNDVSAGQISLVACDFDSSGYVTASDVSYIYIYSGTNMLCYDLDGNGYVTAADASTVYICSGKADYDDITIE